MKELQRGLAAAFITTMVLSNHVRAEEGSTYLNGLYDFLRYGEIVLPDLHAEWDSSRAHSIGVAASVALHYFLEPSHGDWPMDSVFLEPQLRIDKLQYRCLAAMRLVNWSHPLLVEFGGIVGTDGNGGVLGVGWNFARQAGVMAPLLRSTMTDEGFRLDLSFDIVLFPQKDERARSWRAD